MLDVEMEIGEWGLWCTGGTFWRVNLKGNVYHCVGTKQVKSSGTACK